jgi:tripartite-type tricarboxylate transporter receptor subunit TctC
MMPRVDAELAMIGDTMILPRRRALSGLMAAIAASAAPSSFAQSSWPNRPIKLVLPFGPGSASDVLARSFTEPLSQVLKQPIVIEYRPGANSTIGTTQIARSPADGYTLGLLTNSGLAASPGGMSEGLTYDTLKDFSYITLVASLSYVFLTSNTVPPKTLREAVDYIRANPGKLSYGNGNTGGISFMGHFVKSNGLSIAPVQYKSVPPAITDLAAGHVQFAVTDISSAQAMIQAGKIRPLAVPTAQRHPLLPDVPTYTEAGFPTPPDFSGWWVLTAPAGVPGEILDRLNREVVAILKTSEVRESLLKRGITAIPSSREEATSYQREQLQVWTKMVAETGLKAE